MDADNIVKFPMEHRFGEIPKSDDDIHMAIAAAKMSVYEDLTDFYWQRICHEMTMSGIPQEVLESEDFLKSVHLIRESIIAAFCKSVDIEHELHSVAEAISGLRYQEGEHLPEAFYLHNEE
jgi:hypothetical protein